MAVVLPPPSSLGGPAGFRLDRSPCPGVSVILGFRGTWARDLSRGKELLSKAGSFGGAAQMGSLQGSGIRPLR